MSSSTKTDADERTLPAPLLAALVVTTLLTGGFALWRVSPGGEELHPLAFRPVEIDARRMEAIRSRTYSADAELLESEAVGRLHTLVRRANEHHFETSTTGEDPGMTAASLGSEISMAANDVIPRTGYDGFIAAGGPIFDACREGLGEVLTAVRTRKLGIDRAMEDPPADQFGKYRRNCGHYLPRLHDRGLVTDGGTWSEPPAVSRSVAEILQRLRWAHIIASRRRPILQLTDYERQILFRWRIGDDEAYPPERRRAFLERIEEQTSLAPAIDTTLASARLAYQTGDRARAERILRRAVDGEAGEPRNRRTYRRALEWLERHASESGRTGSSGSG